jgi:hypothetical protein
MLSSSAEQLISVISDTGIFDDEEINGEDSDQGCQIQNLEISSFL